MHDAGRGVPSSLPVPSAVEVPVAANPELETTEGAFIVDELADVAPAGPATAHELGILLVTKQDEVLLARRGAWAQSSRRATTPIAHLELPRGALAPYARGPAVVGEHAYWVSRGRLVRRRWDGTGELQILRPDARTGTRVAGGGSTTPAVVAYVSAPNAEGIPQAKLWLEGVGSFDLTPEGSGSSSVALSQQGDGWLAVSLDGRSGMTPLHARRVLRKGNRVALGADVVAWVGASAQPTTEVFTARVGREAWALVPIERDVSHFGLAQVRLGAEPRMDAPASFVPFLNGINSSPVASAQLCSTTAVLYARPSAADPHAPQELVLTELSPDGLQPGRVVAHAKAFADASLTAVKGGGLLSYTADYRTWAAAVRCRR